MITASRDVSFKTAMIGFVLVAPIVYFMSAAVLEHELGIGFLYTPIEALSRNPQSWRLFNLVSPIVFLGGPMLAFLLNMLQVVRLSAHTEPGTVTASVTVVRKPWNLAVAGLCLIMVALLGAYLVAENWQCWLGLKTHC